MECGIYKKQRCQSVKMSKHEGADLLAQLGQIEAQGQAVQIVGCGQGLIVGPFEDQGHDHVAHAVKMAA